VRRARSWLRTVALGVTALLAGALLAAPSGGDALAAGGPRGGDPIYSRFNTYRCALAFNARDSAGAYYFLTSVRCGGGAGTVIYGNSSHTTVLGTTVATGTPDYAIVKYAAGFAPPGMVDLYNGSNQDITTAATAYVGEPVKRSGTTGVHSGSVTGVNVTVATAEGTITGLIRTNVCADSTESGGPLFDGAKALGILTDRAGAGNCSTGGSTFYQPVTGPLAAYGLTVY